MSVIKKAILIGIDGAQLEQYQQLWLQGKAQTIAGLHVVEAYTGGILGSLSEQPTKSGSGWAALLTGTWINRHGVFNNELRPISPDVSSIFQQINKQVPNAKLASIVNWAPINTDFFARDMGLLEQPAIVDFEAHGMEDDSVVAATVELISTAEPDFTFLQLDDVDAVGHKYGFSKEYDNALIRADSQVQSILNAIEQHVIQTPDEDWLVVIATDHGRESSGYSHGGQSLSERRTFIAVNKELEYHVEPVPAVSVASLILDHFSASSDTAMMSTKHLPIKQPLSR